MAKKTGLSVDGRQTLRQSLLTKVLIGSLAGGIVLSAGIFAYKKLTATEICDNGIDDDGDGKIDAYDPDCSTDSDGDGIVDFIDQDDDNDGIPDAVECAGTGSNQFAIINGGFEAPVLPARTYRIMSATEVTGWNTTATDNQIELWSTGFNGITAYEGNQFAELNANLVGGNYQVITTTPGDVLYWSFAHRGRGSSTVADVMRIEIGPEGGAFNFTQNFGNTNAAWGYHSGSYVVPAGQTETRFSLAAVSTASGNNSVGNFVDDFRLYSGGACQLDTDGDGIPNSLDLDSDNDGIPDLVEAGGADANGDGRVDGFSSPTDPTTLADADGDGWYDRFDDNDAGLIGGLDSDLDGVLNFQDLDSDNDGIPDLIEAGGVDTDGDGRVDGIDPDGSLSADADQDGLSDEVDPDADTVFGVENASKPLVTSTDANADGLADAWPAFDNDGNPATAQAMPDFDGDGVPNFQDLDSDNDGIADLIEVGGKDADGNGRVDGLLSGGTFQAGQDADEDGFYDAFDPDDNSTLSDEAYSSRPLISTLANGTGSANGHPALPDYAGNSALNSGSNTDQDQDGMPNYLDLDSDNDGISDLVETWGYTEDDASGQANDGFVDGWASNNTIRDGWHDSYDAGRLKTAADASATERSNNTLPDYETGAGKPDADGDGLPNYLDIDSDGDGIVDLIEGQNSGTNPADPFDGLNQPSAEDANCNGLARTFDASESGGYINPVNTDGTDQPDFLDTDTDNDTFTDLLEGHDGDMNGIADATPSGTDADFDGLDDAFDDNNSSRSVMASNQSVQDSNNDLASGGNRDWRDGTVSSFPVEWLDFTAEAQGGQALLRWATAREVNSSHFVVERSGDGRMFTDVGQVTAAGNTEKTSNYRFTDPQATQAGPRAYYRLRQVDQDGATSYSNRVELAFTGETPPLEIRLSPNPASDQTLIALTGLTRPARLKVLAMNGQVMYQQAIGTTGDWEQELNVSSWTSGTYIVSIEDGVTRQTQKLVVR